MIQAVIFDLDGVLIDSESLWDAARREVVAQRHGHWRDDATRAMQGMSSPEWSRYMHDELGADLGEKEIVELVLNRLLDAYEHRLPLLPGAVQAVDRMALRFPLGLASSANRVVIDKVLEVSGLRDFFHATVSSEEVPRGKPAPDVYVEAARRVGFPGPVYAAVDDSANGIRSAVAAEMLVVAIPNREFTPPSDVLDKAAIVLDRLEELTVEIVERLQS